MADEAASEAALEALRALHARVDAEAARLAARHAGRLACRRGCAGCCVDELTVFSIEAERLRRDAASLFRDGAPHAPGACALLDAEGACRAYAARPYVCRSQGLPLRWLETRAGATVELRDICPLNEAGEPVAELPADACFELGPTEGALAALERAFTGGAPRRVRLRDLFARRG